MKSRQHRSAWFRICFVQQDQLRPEQRNYGRDCFPASDVNQEDRLTLQLRQACLRSFAWRFHINDQRSIALRSEALSQVGSDIAGATEQEDRRPYTIEVTLDNLIDGAQQCASGGRTRISNYKSPGADFMSRDVAWQDTCACHFRGADQALDEMDPTKKQTEFVFVLRMQEGPFVRWDGKSDPRRSALSENSNRRWCPL
jgi:hypothetical protein